MSKSRFGEGERRKAEKKARARERSSFGVILSPLLAPKRSNNLEEKI